LQRLFTTFADGWPGLGLFIQRLVTGIALLNGGLALFSETAAGQAGALHIAGAFLGIFILAGFLTPIAGAFVAVIELWIAFAGHANVWMSITLATLGATLSMIGPGAWSIDARLFGRKVFPS
jgi:putative oxidoreductase